MITCPECGSRRVKCLETGIHIRSRRFKQPRSEVNGDLFKCWQCNERFITGLGNDSKAWDD